MKTLIQLSFVLLLLMGTAVGALAQWHELYATYDDADSNGTGSNTSCVGVIHDNMFVALCAQWSSGIAQTVENYMIPYVNASYDVGRLYTYGYDTTVFQVWTDGAFDQIQLLNAFCIKATADSFIYVANNDPDHNLLVFKFAKSPTDTITVVPTASGVYPREQTGSNPIYAVDVDASGYIYVTNDTTVGKTDDIKIYAPISQWSGSHTDVPAATVDLPDGVYRGIAVTPDGHTIFVSDYAGRKILKYVCSRISGYTLDGGFSCQMGTADTIAGVTTRPSYIGLAYMPSNNILFAAADTWVYLGTGAYRTYTYGRIYLINPNTGTLVSPDSTVSVIDQAKWNFTLTGGYQNRVGGKTPVNVSGYTSTMDVHLDEVGNVYSQYYNGWTVEKWAYNGSLPVITGVQEIGSAIPSEYSLAQNYPNPFNPTTTIEFTLTKSGDVMLKVIDILGQEVATLVDSHKDAGTYRVTFDARSLPSGPYFYKISANGYTEVKKMLLMK